MALFLPVVIFLVSSSVFFITISRKFIYLKKLDPRVIENVIADERGFFGAMWPEIIVYIRNIQFREQGVNLLSEIEKFLRKTRIIFIKLEGVVGRMISNLSVMLRNYKQHKQEEALKKESELTQITQKTELSDIANSDIDSNSKQFREGIIIDDINANNDKQFLKEEEQRLIMEIAKNPRYAALYKELAVLYIQTGEFDDARQCFEKALDLDPADYIIKTKLSRLMRKIRNLPI